MRRLLLIAFFLEIGFALLVLPWSTYWDRNYFAEAVPPMHGFITNHFVRGAVSGLGLVNIAAGLGEILAILMARNTDAGTAPLPGLPRHVGK